LLVLFEGKTQGKRRAHNLSVKENMERVLVFFLCRSTKDMHKGA